MNGDNNSVNDEKQSSSSYRPEHSHQGRLSMSQHIFKPPETEKTIQAPMEGKEKPKYEEKMKAEAKNEQSQYDPSQIFINPNPPQCQGSA